MISGRRVNITLSGKPLIASQQGTKNFMSIEVAEQDFLFRPDEEPSSAEISRLGSSAGWGVRTAETKVPFSHNHLHDLESLWWVAVWVVFYNYISEGTPSRDHFSSAPRDATRTDRLKLAETLFPPTLDIQVINNLRQNNFQLSSFRDICRQLPVNNGDICDRLDILRRLLIQHYRLVEQRFPLIDPSLSKDDI